MGHDIVDFKVTINGPSSGEVNFNMNQVEIPKRQRSGTLYCFFLPYLCRGKWCRAAAMFEDPKAKSKRYTAEVFKMTFRNLTGHPPSSYTFFIRTRYFFRASMLLTFYDFKIKCS